MREIKYRVYHKEHGMCEVANFCFATGEITAQYWSTKENRHRIFTTSRDKSPVCQFTGLLDSNGKEIYVTDIVEYYDSYKVWLKALIRDTGYGFDVRTCVGNKYEQSITMEEFISRYEDDDDIYRGKPIKELRVIGNIHQHPELLESTND